MTKLKDIKIQNLTEVEEMEAFEDLEEVNDTDFDDTTDEEGGIVSNGKEDDNDSIKLDNGTYFVTQNKSLHHIIEVIKKTGGLDKFKYIYLLTSDRNPFFQVSNYNGSTKELSRKNFLLDIKSQYEKQFKNILMLNERAPKVDYQTGEIIKVEKEGRIVIKTINEYEVLIDSLEHVHAMDYDSKKPHSSVYESEENGRKIFNTFTKPKRLRELQVKADMLERIGRITKETARKNGYVHVYVLFMNLLNPLSPENKGNILYGKPDDDSLSFFFNRQAFFFQTLRKTNNYLLFSSEQGVGKNTYYKELVQYLLGKELAYLSTGDAMNEQYSGYMLNKLYIAFDEAEVSKHSDPATVANRIKKLTNEDIEVRAMQKDRFNVANNFLLDIFTNKDILMQLEFKDRRGVVIKSGVNLMRIILKMGYSTYSEFEAKIRAEMDAFIIDLLRLDYDENMAVNGIIYSPYRKRIVSKTNKRIDIISLLIKEKSHKDIQEFFAHLGDDNEDLKDLCNHVKHNFLTGADCKFILGEIMEDFDEKGSDFDKNKFWNDNFGPLEIVKFKNDDCVYTSKSVRKLNKFKPSDLEKCFNITCHDIEVGFDDEFGVDNRDFLDLMEEDGFLE